jgi:hypothetical protein
MSLLLLQFRSRLGAFLTGWTFPQAEGFFDPWNGFLLFNKRIG